MSIDLGMISRIRIPSRPGWYLEIDISQYVDMIIIHIHSCITNVSFQVGLFEGGVIMVDECATFSKPPACKSNSYALAWAALSKIDNVDMRRWPRWDPDIECSDPFWVDYTSELSNVLTVSDILNS